jgi:hypothetical protein
VQLRNNVAIMCGVCQSFYDPAASTDLGDQFSSALGKGWEVEGVARPRHQWLLPVKSLTAFACKPDPVAVKFDSEHQPQVLASKPGVADALSATLAPPAS